MLWSVPAQNAVLFAGYGAGLGWCSRGEGRGGQQDLSPSLWHVFVGGCAGGFAQVSWRFSVFRQYSIPHLSGGGV